MSSAHRITFEYSRPSLLPESPCDGANPPRYLPRVSAIWRLKLEGKNVWGCLPLFSFKTFWLDEGKNLEGREAPLTSGQMGVVDATSAVICLQIAGTNRDPAIERLEEGIRRRKPSSFPNLDRRRDAQDSGADPLSEAGGCGSCCCLGCCLDWGSHKCRNCGELRGFQLRGLCLSACI